MYNAAASPVPAVHFTHGSNRIHFSIMNIVKKPFTVFLLTLLILFNASLIEAQQKTDSTDKKQSTITFEMLREIVREIDKRVQSARERGNKLTEIDAIRALETEYAAKGPAAQMAIANWMLTVSPEVGNYREALRYADVIQSNQPPEQTNSAVGLEGYKPIDAARAIAHVARNARVMMINEAHHVPQHRAFTIELLKTLRKNGFTHFAAETLYEADTKLSERGYPTKQTGYYTAEPVYGDLVRTALKLGYQIVAYEPPYKDADQRERDQARNLFERALKDNPKAKLLVHAGYSHIDESGMKTGAITMAQRFKELTRIDPFTIDQTAMTERSAEKYEHALYRLAVRRGLYRSTVFQNAQGQLWSLDKGTHDVTIFHPRSRYASGRPTWLRLGGSRRPYLLPKNICGDATRCLVRARFASESEEAVPVDQLEVITRLPIPALMLPAGQFVIEVQNAEGKQITTRRIRAHKS